MALVEPGDIAELIASGQFAEGIDLEAKLAGGSIPGSVWESISAFANTSGGALVLGLEENGDAWNPVGVSNARRMVQQMHDLMRDTRKISFPASGSSDIWIERIGDAELVVVRVPQAPRRHRPVLTGGADQAFVRRGEGDARCTTDEIQRMLRDASPLRYDQAVFPYLDISDFDMSTIDSYRRMSEERKPHLAHHRRSDEEFLRLVEAWRVDRDTNQEGPTLAGILMFGTEVAIRQVRSSHVIDYRRLPIGGGSRSERWADRVRWQGNLFGAWMEIFPRLVRGLPVPFRLRGVQRQDEPAGVDALREGFINLLVHTDYRETSDAVILQKDNGYLFRNPGDSWVDVDDLGVQGRSERRNPIIAQMFDNIGLAEQAGSGYVTIFEEWEELGYSKPRAVSSVARYEFELELTLAEMIQGDDRTWLQSIGGPWRSEEELALVFARHKGRIDNQTLRHATNQEVLATSQTLRSLRDRSFLILHGNGRNAYYVLGPAASAPGGAEDTSIGHRDTSTGHSDTSTGHVSVDTEEALTKRLEQISEPVARSARLSPQAVEATILELCELTWLSSAELVHLLRRDSRTVRRYVVRLLKSGQLERQYPQGRHPQQRYHTVTVVPGGAKQKDHGI